MEELEQIKTFKNLEDKIISKSLCCACGACVAYCESQSFDVIEMDNYVPKFKNNKTSEDCRECGFCYYICPQTDSLIDKINGVHLVKDEIGNISDLLAAKTNDLKIKEVGQDGGIVSTILTYLFETGRIEAAVVSEFDENFKPVPKIIYKKEDIIKSAGTRYSISPNILPLKDLYRIAEDIIKTRKNVYDVDQLRVAFIGTPCQCRAISKMRLMNVKPSHVIDFVISLFCFENFDYEKLMNILDKKIKIKPSNIKKVQIKKNMFVTSKDSKEFEINIKDLDEAVRNNCLECDEFVGKYSDLSIGASGAPTGYSIIVIRTDKGKTLMHSLIADGYIEKYKIPPNLVTEWKPKKLNWFRKMTSIKIKK